MKSLRLDEIIHQGPAFMAKLVGNYLPLTELHFECKSGDFEAGEYKCVPDPLCPSIAGHARANVFPMCMQLSPPRCAQ